MKTGIALSEDVSRQIFVGNKAIREKEGIFHIYTRKNLTTFSITASLISQEKGITYKAVIDSSSFKASPDINFRLEEMSISKVLSPENTVNYLVSFSNNNQKKGVVSFILKEALGDVPKRKTLVVVHYKPPFLKQVWNGVKEVAPVIGPIATIILGSIK